MAQNDFFINSALYIRRVQIIEKDDVGGQAILITTRRDMDEPICEIIYAEDFFGTITYTCEEDTYRGQLKMTTSELIECLKEFPNTTNIGVFMK